MKYCASINTTSVGEYYEIGLVLSTEVEKWPMTLAPTIGVSGATLKQKTQ